MRLDPRLTWDDIDMRMEYIGARGKIFMKLQCALLNTDIIYKEVKEAAAT